MNKRLRLNLGSYALVWSLVIGMLTAGYLNLVNWLIDRVWLDGRHLLDLPSHWYPFLICIPAGLLIGYLNKRLGDYPLTIAGVLTQVRMKGAVDYHQWWKSMLLGLLVLSAGGSIGPEASTTVIIGGMVNWLGDRMRWAYYLDQARDDEHRPNIWCDKMTREDLAQAPRFGTLFKDRRQKRLVITLLIVVGIVGAAIIFKLFPEEGVFGIHHRTINWQWLDLLTAIPALAVGIAFGWLFVQLGKWTSHIEHARLDKVWQGGLFGLLLAASTLISQDALFSGEFRIVPFSREALGMTAGYLLLVAVLKAVVTNLGFALCWRGGTIFPAIFASLAIGVACALVLPGTVAVNAAVVLTASLTCILGRPLLTVILLALLVPIELLPVLLVVAYASDWLVKKTKLMQK